MVQFEGERKPVANASLILCFAGDSDVTPSVSHAAEPELTLQRIEHRLAFELRMEVPKLLEKPIEFVGPEVGLVSSTEATHRKTDSGEEPVAVPVVVGVGTAPGVGESKRIAGGVHEFADKRD